MAKDLEQAKYWAMGTVGSLNNGFGGWYGATCVILVKEVERLAAEMRQEVEK